MLRNLAICVVAILAGFWLVSGVIGLVTSAPPEKPAEAAQPAPPPEDPARLKVCTDLLKNLPRGALKTYEVDSEGYGTVVVGPAYFFADFDEKAILDANLRCIMSNGRKDNYGVKYVGYLDPDTHHEIAKWSDVTGFSVD